MNRHLSGRQSVILALKDKKFLTPGQVLILDNASFSQISRDTQTGRVLWCEIVFPPPYSPDLNPIEKYWANMKTKIREFLPSAATLSEAFDSVILSMLI